MKFLHLGDLHVGKSLSDFNLIEDQKYILEQILEVAEKQKVDAVLMAGDIYDKSIPSEEAVKLFDYFLCELTKRKLKTFIISGNHDSDERLNFGSSLFETSQLYISAKYNGELYKRELEDEYGRINVYLLPFVKASQVRHFFPEGDIDSYDKAVRVILEHADIKAEERNILVAHQFVTGMGDDPVCAGSESLSVLQVGNVERIGADCFKDFDYVALGHIHSPQRVGRDEVRYAGSLLKYSLSEANNDKSVPVITLKEKGEVSIELVPLKPYRDLRHLKGRMEQLLDKKNIKNQEDFVYATLTDEDPINDAMGIFRQYYPNMVKIDYDNSRTRAVEQVDIAQITEDKSFSELISDFYRLMYHCEISEEEMALMEKVAGEAGVTDETY